MESIPTAPNLHYVSTSRRKLSLGSFNIPISCSSQSHAATSSVSQSVTVSAHAARPNRTVARQCLCLAKTESAFEINKIQRGRVTCQPSYARAQKER